RAGSQPGALTHSAGTPPALTFSHLASGAPPRKSAIFSNRARAWPMSGVSGAGRERSRVTRLSSWAVVMERFLDVVIAATIQGTVDQFKGDGLPVETGTPCEYRHQSFRADGVERCPFSSSEARG